MAAAFPHTAPAPAQLLRFLACTAALTGSFIGYWLLNYSAFPLFDPIYLWTREASAIAGGLALTTLAFASYWHPRLFTSRRFFAAAASTMIAGSLVMAIGIFGSLPIVLICGAALVTMGTGLSNIIVGIGCIGLDTRRLGVSVTLAYVLAYTLRGVFALLPWGVNLALFCIVPLVAVLIIAPYARPLLNQVHAEGSPAQAAVTAPSSFLPFGHQLFVTLLLFRFIYGTRSRSARWSACRCWRSVHWRHSCWCWDTWYSPARIFRPTRSSSCPSSARWPDFSCCSSPRRTVC